MKSFISEQIYVTFGVDLEERISLSQMNETGKGPSKKRTVCTRKQPESRAETGEGKGAPGEAAIHGP